jgi:glycerophosphoryl diester phosphodiesterase
MLKIVIKVVLCSAFFMLVAGVVYTTFFAPELKGKGQVVAYRGGGSLVDYEKLGVTDCTAVSLKESGLFSVENTHEAVAKSVAAGVDIIHLNVHRTRDDHLVVFHDWTLDCATNGTGPVNKKSFAELELIDAGYGYTFDDGRSFPFRGKGFKISKLNDFHTLYPEHAFWLNLKNNDERSFNILHAYLTNLNSSLASNTMVITSSKGMQWFELNAPDVRVASVNSVKSCGIDYLLVGWAGLVPESCRNTTLFIPPSMAGYFWGFPERLASRLQKHGTEVYLWSQHNAIDATYRGIVNQGVGVITSDIDFVHELQANKSIHPTANASDD